jgi:hypothetical protein
VRGLKAKLDANDGISLEELITQGLVPREDVFEIGEELVKILDMDQG